MNLIIVESPAKARTIKNFLGKGYEVIASKGHIRDLPKSRFGITIDEETKEIVPTYSVAKEKLAIVSALIEYLLFIVWIGGGIAWLENMALVQDDALKSIFMVLGFVFISGIVTLPLDWYSKFVMDEEFGFNRSSLGLFIKGDHGKA